MEYQKTKRDIEQEKIDNAGNPVVVYLKNRESLQFSIGDILIRQWKNGDGTWRTEKHGSDAPKKYLYAFENEVGIGYLKGYNADGKMSEVPLCVTEFASGDQRLMLDPEYADHIMIGEGEFDPLELQREKKNFRTRMMNRNRKLLVSIETPAEIMAWVKSLKVGDTFHYGYGIADMVESKYEVIAISDGLVKDVTPSYSQDNIKKVFSINSGDSYPMLTLKPIKHRYQTQVEKVGAIHFQRRYVTMKEPYRLTDAI